MMLVDTSVWVQHLREGDSALEAHLEAGEILAHPLVIGELAMGNLGKRAQVLRWLSALPRAIVASDAEVLVFIEREKLHGRGAGYVDAHLLASTRLTQGTRLWTLDRRLAEVAAVLGVA